MVSDDEILEAYRLLASREGIFGEPASAASLAGLMKLVQQGLNLAEQRVVCIITGTGLKDPGFGRKQHNRPYPGNRADHGSLGSGRAGSPHLNHSQSGA